MTEIILPPTIPIVAPPPPGAPDPASPEAFRSRIGALAGHLESLRYVTGRRGLLAALRRMESGPCDIPPAIFWDLADRFGIPIPEERIWMRLLPLMAGYPHDGHTGPGLAFARARVSAPRLERWLRADHEQAWDEVPRLLDRVRGTGVDWVRLGVLLRYWTPELRRALAREFFRSPEYRNRNAHDGD